MGDHSLSAKGITGAEAEGASWWGKECVCGGGRRVAGAGKKNKLRRQLRAENGC